MSTEFKGPLHTKIKELIKLKKTVDFKLINSEVVTGQIIWQDQEGFCLSINNNETIVILKAGVISFKEHQS